MGEHNYLALLLLPWACRSESGVQDFATATPNRSQAHNLAVASYLEQPANLIVCRCDHASTRAYKGLPDIDYPFHDKIIVVTNCGRLCLGRKKINFSTVFAGQAVGIKEVHDDIWLVSFMDYDLGYFDLETRVLEPLENPFGPKVLPM